MFAAVSMQCNGESLVFDYKSLKRKSNKGEDRGSLNKLHGWKEKGLIKLIPPEHFAYLR